MNIKANCLKEKNMRDIKDYTKVYKQNGFENIQVFYRRKKVLEIINKLKPKRILEIGCGMEPLFPFYSNYEKFVVIEPSKDFYENAIKLSDKNNKVTCINQCLDSEFIKNNQIVSDFDLIICSCLLHEIENTDSFLKAIHNLCNQDTVVHINVPNSHSFHRLLAKHIGLIKDEHQLSERNVLLQQQRVFDLSSLEKTLIEAGFYIIDKGSFFIKPFTHSQMEKLIESGICDDKMLDGFFSLTEDLPDFGSEIFVNCKI